MPLILPKGEAKHYGELDSLRGLAAVAVMFHHFHFLWEDGPHPRWAEWLFMAPPFKFLVSGHASVVLFFLLSGFVLGLPQIRGKRQGYAGYIAKRVCRIYLPYLSALGLALLGCWKFHGLDAYGYWFHLTWYEAPRWKLALQHVLFIGSYDQSAYNTAFWSLVQEMRISILFPFVCALVLRFGNLTGVGICVVLTVIAATLERFTQIPLHVLWTISFTGTFILGILTARCWKQMGAWLEAMPKVRSRLFILGSVLLFFYAHRLAGVLRTGQWGEDLITAAGGVGLIVCALSNRRASALLMGRVSLFLGRISYSMYLLHGTVLFFLVYATHQRLPLLAILVPYLAITIGLATLMYEVVEVPSINLGRAIARRLERRSTAASQVV